MLGEISSAQLAEWRAYARLEPFGEEMANLRSAQLLAFLANAFSGKESEPKTIDDFMFRFGSEFYEDEEESPDEQIGMLGFGLTPEELGRIQRMKAVFLSLGAKVIDKDGNEVRAGTGGLVDQQGKPLRSSSSLTPEQEASIKTHST